MEEWTEDGILYQMIHEREIDEISSFLFKYFFPDEPMYIGIGYEIDDVVADFTSTWLLKLLESHLSFKAVDPVTKETMAIRLNDCSANQELPDITGMIDTLPAEKQENMKKCATHLRFLSILMDQSEFANIFPTDSTQILEMVMLCTSPNFRKRGLGSKLVDQTIKFARRSGYKAIKGSVTGAFSKKIYDNLGFEKLREIQYKGYEMDGEEIFVNDMGVHTSGAFYIMRL